MNAAVVLALLASSTPADDVREVLFDFEPGIQDWFGNPWGGGECEVEASDDAKFGTGALACIFRDVERGANAVSPDLPMDAAWRDEAWGGLSLWLKGDGSAAKARIQVETYQSRGPGLEGNATFSVSTPLEDDSWHRVQFAFSRFWSREKLSIDPAAIRRVIIGLTGTHTFFVDQVALEPPGREAWTDPDAAVAPGPWNDRLLPPAWTIIDDGRFEARLDLTPVADQPGLGAKATLSVPGGQGQADAAMTANVARAGETSLAIPLVMPTDGQAEARVTVRSGADTLADWGCSFPVFGPTVEPEPPPIAVYPVPKHLALSGGTFRFAGRVRVATTGMEAEDARRTIGMFADEMAAYYGRKVDVADGGEVQMACLVGDLPNGTVAPELAARFGEVGEEGYLLSVTPDMIVVAAHQPRGIYYGLQSLLAAIDGATDVPSEAVAPCCEVADWPTFPFRGASIPNPTNRWGHPNDPSFDVHEFNEFVFRTMARQKLNKLVFIVPEGMQFESHPELAAPNAWSKDELRDFIDFARDHYIEVIPLVTVLGHASWFTVKHKELVEPGNDHNIACYRLPETNALITEVMEEVIELFEPETVHLGMDECWWTTLNVPEEERCPRCKEDWADIVVDQATLYRDLLAERGIRAMMWDDMLLPEHNGGAPYHTARALPRIPKDITITNWSAGLAPDSSKRFRDAGLQVVRSNSRGVPRAEAPYVIGNMMGIWSKNAWLTDTYHKTSAAYSYLSLVQAAEHSWNVDSLLTPRGLDREFLAQRADSVLRRIALQPSPDVSGEQTPIDLSSAYNTSAEEQGWGLSELPRGEVEVARRTFSLPDTQPDAVAGADGPVSVALDQPAAEVDLLMACHLAPEDHAAFSDRFKEKPANRGVLIGSVDFAYADGTLSSLPLLYARNILPWDRSLSPPHLYGALGSLSAGLPGDPDEHGRPPQAHAFVLQWVNPNPDQRVHSVTLTTAGTEAVPVLLAATRR